MSVKRGEVFWWNCPDHNRPHLLKKTRPVLVVSNNTCNLNSAVITVAPLTTKVKRAFPTQVPIVINDGVSIVLLDKITSIPIEELGTKIGLLKDWQMAQVDQSLRVQLGLEDVIFKEDKPDYPMLEKAPMSNRWGTSQMQDFCQTYEDEGVPLTSLKFGLSQGTTKVYYTKFKKKIERMSHVTY